MAGEQQSVRSSLKSDSSKKSKVISSIRSNKKPIIIQGINLVGWLALLILVITSSVVFL